MATCINLSRMSNSGGDGDQDGGGQSGQDAPRDLIDFYRRWDKFRQTAVRLADRPDLSMSERQTISWMILLVDRIGERDLPS